MPATIMETPTARTWGQSVDSARHPVARRTADVLRSRSATPNVFIIDDEENIAQAVESGILLDSIHATHSAVRRDPRLLGDVDPAVPRFVISDSVARDLFGDQKQARVFAIARAPRPWTLDELARRPGDIVILDGVQLVGNIGAIARTACALGAAGLILLESGLRTPLDRRLIRASRGLVFATPLVVATRVQCAAFLARERITIAALTADAAQPLHTIRTVEERLALVLGGERHGISADLEAVTDHRYAIPMSSNVESLNVSVAAGIALYEHLSRHRTQ